MEAGLSFLREVQSSVLFPATLSACALLAACGTTQPAVAPPGVAATEPEVAPPVPWPSAATRQSSDAENLLSYFSHLRKLSGPELAREHDSARQAFSTGRSEYNRVRLAMVVALPNTPFSDESRALDLLEPLAKSHDPQLSGLAYLLASQIQERKRLDSNMQALQQKLYALKSLERSLIERKR
jgi:hypothetical protein